MTLDRRRILQGMGAAGLLAGATAPTVGAAQTVRLRKPISTLSTSDPDVEAMRRAIPLMRQSGAWADQVALHADMRHRHHSSWRFMPWHRLQLVWFERHVARLSGKADFAIPYWDWDDDRIPDLFLYDETFYVPGREAQQYDTISDFLRRNGQVLTGRLTDDFPTFFGRPRGGNDPTDGALGRRYYSGSGEWGGHNLIHGFVGGDMGDLSRSPNDPLFWLHHANIDRIYALWRDRHYSVVPPKAWRNESLGGFIDPWGRTVSPVAAATTLDTTTFGYAYPQDPTPPIVFFAAAPPPPVKRRKSYSWRMQRMGPASAFIEISPALASATATQATGYLEIQPDPHRPSMVTLTGRALKGGAEVFRDAVFLVPMGHSMGPQGYRIPMQRLWSPASAGGVRLEIEAAPLAGRKASAMPTTLVDFVLDADLAFLA
jgi:hypothetical protein